MFPPRIDTTKMYPRPEDCILYRPLLLSIPPEGTTIACPVHGSHFLQGSRVTC